MPNGVSCLYFAGKNFIYGKKEGNVFKDGIGVIQTVRGADFLASDKVVTSAANATAATAKNPVLNLLGNAAKTLKKILYPLIVVSGIFNTIKSKDKVKTGASQATGIGMMYGMEQVAEKALVGLENKIFSNEALKNNKKARIAWYVLRGVAYATASLTGYKTGNKVAGDLIDKIRNSKAKKAERKAKRAEEKAIKKQIKSIAANIQKAEKDEKAEKPNVFEDIEAIL